MKRNYTAWIILFNTYFGGLNHESLFVVTFLFIKKKTTHTHTHKQTNKQKQQLHCTDSFVTEIISFVQTDTWLKGESIPSFWIQPVLFCTVQWDMMCKINCAVHAFCTTLFISYSSSFHLCPWNKDIMFHYWVVRCVMQVSRSCY